MILGRDMRAELMLGVCLGIRMNNLIFKHIIPDVYLKSIYHLNTSKLKEKGINSLLLDLDNTLVEHTVDQVSPSLMDWINSLQCNGFKIMILSNNIKKRVAKLAELIDVPFIHLAKKP